MNVYVWWLPVYLVKLVKLFCFIFLWFCLPCLVNKDDYIDTSVRRIRKQFQFFFCKLSTEFAQYLLRWHYVRKKLPFALSYSIVRSLNIKHFMDSIEPAGKLTAEIGRQRALWMTTGVPYSSSGTSLLLLLLLQCLLASAGVTRLAM